MSGGTLTSLVIGVAVLALLVVRQLSVRRLNESYRLVLIIAIIGVVEFVSFLNAHHGHRTEVIEAVLGSLAIAAVTGAIRAPTVKIWRDDSGQLLRQGTWLTAVFGSYRWRLILGMTPWWAARRSATLVTRRFCCTSRSPSSSSG
jgi:hypothetical protein